MRPNLLGGSVATCATRIHRAESVLDQAKRTMAQTVRHGRGERVRYVLAGSELIDTEGYVEMATLNPIELQKALKGVSYPVTKQDLMGAAESNGASTDIRSALEALPDGRFETPADVTEAIDFGGDGGDAR